MGKQTDALLQRYENGIGDEPYYVHIGEKKKMEEKIMDTVERLLPP